MIANPEDTNRQHVEPIKIDDVSVVELNDTPLRRPIPGRATLHLYPRVRFTIEFDRFPQWAFQIFKRNPCRIKTEKNIEFEGFLQYNLNEVFYSNSEASASFVPKVVPCTVLDTEAKIVQAKFSVINFQKFFGRTDETVTCENKTRRIGSAKLNYDGFRIEITERLDLSDKENILRKNDGYVITHEGILERCDGGEFSVSKTENILRGVRVSLSFARGAACSLAPITAIDSNGQEASFQWGTTFVDSWRFGSDTWLPKADGGDTVVQLLPKFLQLCDNPDWNRTILSVVDWYINGNSSAAHVAVILHQAALEAICYKLDPKCKTEDVLRMTLDHFDINRSIPNKFVHLRNFSSRHIRIERQRGRRDYKGDGPETIIQLRNDLVHGEKFYPVPSVELQIEAMRLSRWYIETIMLKHLGYSGRYFNRVTEVIEILN